MRRPSWGLCFAIAVAVVESLVIARLLSQEPGTSSSEVTPVAACAPTGTAVVVSSEPVDREGSGSVQVERTLWHSNNMLITVSGVRPCDDHGPVDVDHAIEGDTLLLNVAWLAGPRDPQANSSCKFRVDVTLIGVPERSYRLKPRLSEENRIARCG